MEDINFKHIARGFFNNLTNKEDELYKDRISVCKLCPLLKKDKVFGNICSDELYLNTNTGETSKEEKSGFRNGCGCILRAKTRVLEAHCPLDKW